MGNQQSNDASGSPSTPSAVRRGGGGEGRAGGAAERSSPAIISEGKRHSLSSHGSQKRKAPAPPSNPTTTLVSSPATSTTSTTSTHATATTISASPKRTHNHTHRAHGNARAQSITTATPQLAALDAASISHQHFDPSRDHDHASPTHTIHTMGQSDSKFAAPHPPSRTSTLPIHPAHKASPTSEPPDQQSDELKPESLSNPPPASPSAHPVDVPHSTEPTTTTDGPADADKDDKEDDYVPTGHFEPSSYTVPAANYSRPPRLPLPIEEEVHTPGSPISTPQDVPAGVKDVETSALDQAEVEGTIPRKASVLSSTTIDDDEVGDNEAFANEAQWGEIRVPTTMEWHGGGDKIFVTGTFCNWEKKVKLHRNKDKSGFSATVNLRPGTHHIKFLVDGEMVTSNELPTTVDWTNILVNYIEIVAPLPTGTQSAKQAPAPAAPMPIPGAAITAGQATGTDEPAARPLRDAEARAAETEAGLPITPQEPVGPKGERQDSLSAQTPTPGPAAPPATQKPQPQAESKPSPAPPKQILPRPKYTNEIPEFLIDLDNYNNPEDERFRRAQRAANTLPQPPSLPMFLSKSILNGATPHKDDASVLIMPNHTVLNHLATSSIKGGVLATSGTTRYKRKFLTTIMYKPTSDDG